MEKFVILFYTKALKDERLSTFFIEKLGDDLKNEHWQKHITILTNFWLTIITGSTDYKGQPFLPHTQIHNLKKESFEAWIDNFYFCVDKCFSQEIALKFKERSAIIASNFMRNLGI